MQNVSMLQEKINGSGYKTAFIADRIGLTPQGLYKKLSSGSEWTFSQVKILQELLKLSPDEVDEIFFVKQ